MQLYLIPGLGYDTRIFSKLDFGNFTPSHINWIEPLPAESIRDYSIRLFEQVPEKEDGIILIGHSFGGVVAQEIAAVKRVEKIILLSSVKARTEIPLSFKMVNWLKLHRVFTKALSIKTIKYWGKGHGFVEASDQALFKCMVGSHSNNYLQWALKRLSEWQAPTVPATTTLVQIHGDNDKTFPVSLLEKPDVVIPGGTHIVVYKQPDLVSKLLQEELSGDNGKS